VANVNVIQSSFSYGELSPLLYAQANFEGYQKGVKNSQNWLSIPQGGFIKRWGTSVSLNTTALSTNKKYIEISTFAYDPGTSYLLIWSNNSLNIVFENVIVATVATTYPQEIVQELYFVSVDTRYIILHKNKHSRQLIRSASAANPIAAVGANTLDVTNALTVGQILPITFTTAGTLPTSNPQLYINTIYYAKVLGANQIAVYNTSADAAADVNRITYSAPGAGVSNVIVQNTWTLSDIAFSNYPAYDFDQFATYSAAGFTFQVSAVSGTIAAPTTITSSAAVFTAANVGGLFTGGGGVARIIGFTNATNVTATTYVPFNVAVGAAGRFSGAEVFLGEPAWSDARGWPAVGAYFQERLWLASSRSIPNGLWGSSLFQVYDFDDSEELDNNAISDYSCKTTIRALSAAKTLIVHCDVGIYSTSLTANVPLTPRTFNLDEQNPDGINNIQPVFIDNQIIYVDKAANNVKNMNWDIVQSSYVNTNISVQSSHIPSAPIDMATFSEPVYTDGLYVFIVNEDGSLAIYQTLLEQNIRSWTHAITDDIAGQFARVATINNRCWFLMIRYIWAINRSVAITGIVGTFAFRTAAHGITVGELAYVTFTGVVLPSTNPQIVLNQFYWVRALTADTIQVFATLADAEADINFINVFDSGTLAFVDIWELTPNSFIEELRYDYKTDCTTLIENNVPFNSIVLPAFYAGKLVQVKSTDTYIGLFDVPANLTINLGAPYTSVQSGFGIDATLEFLPLSMGLPTGPNLYNRKHIRTLYVQYYNTAVFKLNGYNVPGIFQNPINPVSGVYYSTSMDGWDSFAFNITITQNLPLETTILGIGYNVEV